MRTPRKINPRIEYLLRQRDRIENSPSIAKKFPRLSSLQVDLMFYDSKGVTRQQEMKCHLNLEHSKSMLCFPCSGGECVGGDFDLSEALAKSVAAQQKVATGEIRCQGGRARPNHETVPCQALLRYKLTLAYD